MVVVRVVCGCSALAGALVKCGFLVLDLKLLESEASFGEKAIAMQIPRAKRIVLLCCVGKHSRTSSKQPMHDDGAEAFRRPP